MDAIFYQNLSDERYLNKRINAIGRSDSFYFKDDTNIVNPTFKVNYHSITENANYVYIPDVGRYYYIRNKIYSKQCLYLECEVDVLMSFKDNIKLMSAIISRNERLYNLYLSDDKMEIYNYPYYQTINLKCVEGTPFNMGINNILLAIAGSVEGDK